MTRDVTIGLLDFGRHSSLAKINTSVCLEKRTHDIVSTTASSSLSTSWSTHPLACPRSTSLYCSTLLTGRTASCQRLINLFPVLLLLLYIQRPTRSSAPLSISATIKFNKQPKTVGFNKQTATTTNNKMGDFDLGLLDDDDYKVSVLRTKLLGIAECFMYRLPKGSSSPYR
jgi:hypothetical protein